MNKPYRNVCDLVVPNDLCIGCGVCAGICPVNVLTMRFSELGTYIPVEKNEDCLPTCDLCLRACPFTNQEDNEDTLARATFGHLQDIQHKPVLGYHLQSYAGYSEVVGHRKNGSSGGLATWFLETLLAEEIVDKVVCVVPNFGNAQKLFQFAVLDSVEAVRSASRSCYYPVEMSEAIRTILGQPGRYAVIGLPCLIKGLRLAMRRNARLHRRIVVLAGLVCGQTKTRFFTEYLCASCGGDPNNLVEVHFRLKDPKRSARDYVHRFIWQYDEQRISCDISSSEGVQDIWAQDYFKPNACNYCDDLFAEVADVVFLDAWLPEYDQDWRGTNFLLIRSLLAMDLLKAGVRRGELTLEEVSTDKIIRSQAGGILAKRDHLAYRLYIALERGNKNYPVKRVEPKRMKSLLDRWLLDCRERMRVLSNEKFSKLGRPLQQGAVTQFDKQMSGLVYLYRAIGLLRRVRQRLLRYG